MSAADAVAAVLWAGVTLYAVFGGADFGAGFWTLVAGESERGTRARALIDRAIGPVWESNHVWLIFVLVVMWTCFPVAFGSIMSTLYVPLLLAAAGIILRGTAFAVRGQAATLNEARGFGALFALSSVLVPFCLGAALGGIASGRVPVGNALGAPWESWLNPTSLLVGALAVVTGAYLAAVYLAGDAAKLGEADLVAGFRARALGAGVLSGVIAIGGLAVVRSDARPLYDGLTSGGGLVCVVASGVLGVATLALVWTRRFELARAASTGAVACVVVGWAFAQSPDLLPGALTLDQAAAGDATLTALLISVAVGLLILVPSLVLLYRLVLRGDLYQGFEPLDQQFRPLTSDDHPEEP
jgi:cytochrome bd ubiquinol oxidase subunit II